jgi:hypothetical protein
VLSLPMRVHVIARVCACRCVRLRVGARAWVARHRHDCAWRRCHIGFMCAVCEHGKPGFPEYPLAAHPALYAYIRACPHAHENGRAQSRTRTYNPRTQAHTSTHARTHTRTSAHEHTCTHMHTHAHTHRHTCTRTRAHTLGRAHKHTHAHTQGRRAQLPRAAVPLQGVRGTAGGPRP